MMGAVKNWLISTSSDMAREFLPNLKKTNPKEYNRIYKKAASSQDYGEDIIEWQARKYFAHLHGDIEEAQHCRRIIDSDIGMWLMTSGFFYSKRNRNNPVYAPLEALGIFPTKRDIENHRNYVMEEKKRLANKERSVV